MRAIPHTIAMFFALIFCALPLNSKGLQNTKKSGKAIVVMVQEVHGRVTYMVDSKPTPDPLRALGIQIEQRGEDWPVIVLLDWNTPLWAVDETEKIADKAGFKNVRSFVFSAERRDYISEIKFGRGILFTTNPPPD